MNRAVIKNMVFFIVPWAVTMFICVVLVLGNFVTLSINSFAVDSQDRLYIGIPEEIRVYEADTLVDCLPAHTSRSYVFTIAENDTILLSTSTKIYIMDLSGNVLSEKDDIGADTYNQMQYKRKNFVSSNGDSYQLKSVFGRTKIVKNGTTTVFQISTFSAIVKYLLGICCLASIAFAGWIIIKVTKRRS